MFKKLRAAATLAVLAGSALAAQAGLVGSTVKVDFYFPDLGTLFCSSGNAVVGAGVEYANGCSGFSPVGIDFTDTGFVVTHANTAFAATTFNGFVVDVVSGLDFDTVSYVGGSLGVTSATVSGGNLFINFAGQGSGRAEFSFTQAGGTVPEPASLALVGLGLVAAGALRRGRQTAA